MSKDLEKRVEAIEARNRRVELDKAWEISWVRRFSIAGLTYLVIVIFMQFTDIERPFLNAIVPTVGFTLSTLSISYLKKWWISRQV